MRIGCVVLTTGDRPEELRAAIESVENQRDATVEIAVVYNSDADDPPILPGIRVLTPGSNLGIPEGRNVGAAALSDCDLLFFLDDDGMLVHDDTLRRVGEMFIADPKLGVVSLRIVDPATGRTERRHVPRLLVGDPARSSWVTTFLGGAAVIRHDAYSRAGGLPGEFFYAHEETSLAWRLLDLGYRIRYAGDLMLAHPAAPPARHDQFHRLTARNRVLLARKHLPLPLAPLYVGLWFILGMLRAPAGRAAALQGYCDGLRAAQVERAPIRWRTVARMARYGRPPLL